MTKDGCTDYYRHTGDCVTRMWCTGTHSPDMEATKDGLVPAWREFRCSQCGLTMRINPQHQRVP
jgi:hypothetical protein